MATPGQNPQNQQSPDDLQKAIDAMSSKSGKLQSEFAGIVDSTREIRSLLQDTSTTTKLYLENATAIKNIYSETRSLVAKLGTEYIDQEQVTKRIKENESLTKTIQSQKRVEMNEYKKAALAANRTIKSQKDIVKDVANIIENGTKDQKKQIPINQLRIYLLKKEEEALKQNEKILNGINAKLDQGNTKVENAKVKAAALAKIFQSFSGIPFLKDFMNFEKIGKAFDAEQGGSIGKGFKSLGTEIMRIVKSPLFLLAAGILAIVSAFKSLVKLAFDYDKIVTDISNNLGTSKDTAVDLLDTFRAISSENVNLTKSLDSAFISVKNQAAALLDLQETLGTNVLFTNRTLQNQIFLTKQLKMSKEEAAGIQKFYLLTGRSAESILQSALKQNTTAISYRKIFSEIAKVNAELSIAYKNNPDLIAKAVIQANKLGLSLEQTQKIAKGLLDFETSISGELEAELLLGKQFNFEKARSLALDGKSSEAAAELINQIGGLNALTNMNVIQRERLAASINLSTEELVNSAREQEILNKLGFENRDALEERYEILRRNNDLEGISRLQAEARKKEGGELLLQDIARANLQDRFNESVERLKQIFTELSTSLIPILTSIAKLLQNTQLLKIVLASIAAIAAGIATAMVIATGGAALVGAAVAAGAVGVASYAAMSSTGGAGERALPSMPMNKPVSYSSTPADRENSGTAEISSKLDKLISVTEKRGGDVFVDTVRSGTAYGMSATKYA